MKTAKKIGVMTRFKGDAGVYRLSEPVTYGEYDDDSNYVDYETDTVIVSAVVVPTSGPETMIFPVKQGDVGDPVPDDLPDLQPHNFVDIACVRALDHRAALESLGDFEVVD
jgi:hypothetical protein